MDWKKWHWHLCQDVLIKAKTIFAISCYVNFTSVCKIGKAYLFYKDEGFLIDKDDTSVLRFTVHMPPVCHLIFFHYK